MFRMSRRLGILAIRVQRSLSILQGVVKNSNATDCHVLENLNSIRHGQWFMDGQTGGVRSIGSIARGSLSECFSSRCVAQVQRPEVPLFRSRSILFHACNVRERGFYYGVRASAATFSSDAQTSRGSAGEGLRTGLSSAQMLERNVRKAGSDRSQNMLMYLLAMVVAVVGGTYASVPLYRRFCQATGFGGTTQRRETVEEKVARHGSEDLATARELVITFNADVADSMPWKFTPCQHQVKVRPGQSTLVFYTAENTSSEAITGVSTYNVAPMQAGVYFNKIQCFCFEEQRLRAGEKIDMPVLFYIDPEFAEDPKMDNINSLILSYTFFKVEEDEDEE